jgi:hypothetical protein
LNKRFICLYKLRLSISDCGDPVSGHGRPPSTKENDNSCAGPCLLTLAALPAWAQGVIKIGEINSYKAQPAFLEPYKKGMELAVEQVNAAGGIAGKKLQLIVRDDNATPGDAVRAAEELYTREKSMCSRAAFSRMWAWH